MLEWAQMERMSARLKLTAIPVPMITRTLEFIVAGVLGLRPVFLGVESIDLSPNG